MERKTLIPLFLILAIVSIGYAVYRSTAQHLVETVNGRQIIYNEPQHGLLMGLCVFAGLCLVAIALLYRDPYERNVESRPEVHTTVTKRSSTNYPQ
jgi:hypothetical protein